MSINMRVLAIEDEQAASFAGDPKRAHAYVAGSSIPKNAADLYEHWRALDYLLGGHSFIMNGDTVIDATGDEPIHAIRSSNVPSLLQPLNELSTEELRKRLEPVRMRAAGLWVPDFPGYVNRLLPELSSALDELRNVVTAAATTGKGLLVWRYEWL